MPVDIDYAARRDDLARQAALANCDMRHNPWIPIEFYNDGDLPLADVYDLYIKRPKGDAREPSSWRVNTCARINGKWHAHEGREWVLLDQDNITHFMFAPPMPNGYNDEGEWDDDIGIPVEELGEEWVKTHLADHRDYLHRIFGDEKEAEAEFQRYKQEHFAGQSQP